MDPKLAEIYGTNQEADLEKLAAAELAEGLANDDQLDTDGMTEEELEAVAQEVLNASAEGDEGGEEGGNIDGEQEKVSAAEEAQEKLAEADYLGRVMAHSYVNELRNIEKTASDGIGDQGVASKQTKMEKVKEMGGKAKEVAKAAPGQVGRALRGSGAGGMKGALGMGAGGKRAAQVWAARAGATGLAAAAGLKAKKMMKKEEHQEKQSSALDTLVEARAQEILAASGIDPAELTQVEGQEKVSDPREALASAVDERAWALLGQFGVVPADQE